MSDELHAARERLAQIVIPARLASTRLLRKLLLRETGKPLIQHTYEAACRARRPLGVIVAADHEEIADAVKAFGGQVVMTSPDCASGTDRVAEVARGLPDVDVFINVQGDEPELSGDAIDRVVELLDEQPDAVMATLATPIRTRDKLHDPACVKVVCDSRGRALYFSRSPIPHAREWDDRLLSADPAIFLQHLGLYAYRRDFLLKLAEMPPSRCEQTEKLEQLRVLETGRAILVGVVDEPTIGIDTPEDYRAFVERCRRSLTGRDDDEPIDGEWLKSLGRKPYHWPDSIQVGVELWNGPDLPEAIISNRGGSGNVRIPVATRGDLRRLLKAISVELSG